MRPTENKWLLDQIKELKHCIGDLQAKVAKLEKWQALEGEPRAYEYQWRGKDRVRAVCKPEHLPTNGDDLIVTPLYTHPASADVPDAEYFRALQEAFDIIQSDANTEENYRSMCQIGSVLRKLKAKKEKGQ